MKRVAVPVLFFCATVLAASPPASADRPATPEEVAVISRLVPGRTVADYLKIRVSTVDATWAVVTDPSGESDLGVGKMVARMRDGGWETVTQPGDERADTDCEAARLPGPVGEDLNFCFYTAPTEPMAPRLPGDTALERDLSGNAFETRLGTTLTSRYGARFTGATVRYVRCPKSQGGGERGSYSQFCRYAFGTGAARTVGAASFALRRDGVLTLNAPRATTSSRSLARCSTRYANGVGGIGARAWRVVSLRASRAEPGCTMASLMVGDYVYDQRRRTTLRPAFRTFTHGTSTLHFDDLVVWHCKRTGIRLQTVSCSNRLGLSYVAKLRRR